MRAKSGLTVPNVRPLRDLVLCVRRSYNENRLIILPHKYRAVSQWARVIACGPQVTDVKPGEWVLLDAAYGIDFNGENGPQTLTQEANIIAALSAGDEGVKLD